MNKNAIKGFTLIETLVFIAILSLFFVVAAAISTATLHNMQATEHKIIATRYAEELSAWLRYKKESNWGAFYTSASPVNPGDTSVSYCFDGPISDTWPSPNTTCLSNGITGSNNEKIYKRMATLTVDSSIPQVNATVVVSWSDGNATNNITMRTAYTLWEK